MCTAMETEGAARSCLSPAAWITLWMEIWVGRHNGLGTKGAAGISQVQPQHRRVFWDMPRKANTMNLEELSGLGDLGSSPNQQGCFSWSQADRRTAEVLSQSSSSSVLSARALFRVQKKTGAANVLLMFLGVKLFWIWCVTTTCADLELRWGAGIQALTDKKTISGGTKTVI